MRKVREVLRLKYEQKLSNRLIGTSCRISVGSVHDYLQRVRVAGLSWPLPDGLTDEGLDRLLFPPASSLPSNRPMPDWDRLARELRRKGVTLALLWEEYRAGYPEQNAAAGHGEVKNVLLYYWGDDGQLNLAPGQGGSLSGSNLATWNPSQLYQLRTLGLTPFVALESLDTKDIQALMRHLREGGCCGQSVIVRLASEPDGSHYADTPAAYRYRFESASRLMKALGKASGIDIKVAFTVCGTGDFRYTPDSRSYDYIGIDLFVTPENVNEVVNLIQQVSVTYPNKALVVPEFGIATSGERGNAHADSAWAEQTTHTILSDLLSGFRGRVKSLTPYDVDAKDRITNRVWSWVWTPAMYEQLIVAFHLDASV